MIVHDVEPLLVIVAALIKLFQFFFHFTPKWLSRWKRRLSRGMRAASRVARVRPERSMHNTERAHDSDRDGSQ